MAKALGCFLLNLPMGKEHGMTRKDYVLIAEAIRKETDSSVTDSHIVRRVAYAIADVLQRDNIRFNSETFIKACGFNP